MLQFHFNLIHDDDGDDDSFKHFLLNVFFSGVKSFQQAGMNCLWWTNQIFCLKMLKKQPTLTICLFDVFLVEGVTQLTTAPLKAIQVKKTKIRWPPIIKGSSMASCILQNDLWSGINSFLILSRPGQLKKWLYHSVTQRVREIWFPNVHK